MIKLFLPLTIFLAIPAHSLSMSFITKHNSDFTDYALECYTKDRKKVGHITFHTNENRTNAVIRRMYVEPTYRNQKIGSQLLLRALELLRSHSIPTVEVESVDSKHFFMKHGAVQVDEANDQLLTNTVPLVFYLDSPAQSAHKEAQ